MRQKSDEKLQPISVYLPISIMEKVVILAKKERRSVSAEVVILLEKALS